jgi:hypothetical protein
MMISEFEQWLRSRTNLRRTGVTEMRMTDLPLDLVSQRVIRVVPLKGARAEEEGRVILVAPATARAIAAYLRAPARPRPMT